MRRKKGIGGVMTYVLGGTMLVAAFAVAGHHIGQKAVAHTSSVQAAAIGMTAMTESVAEKSSLLLDKGSFEQLGLATLRGETVVADGKADMLMLEPGEAPEPVGGAGLASPRPVLKPAQKVASLAQQRLRIMPAAFNAGETLNASGKATKRMAIAAKPDDIDQSFKLKPSDKQKVVAQRRARLAEENCLARAIYFEARSESEIGQMAVAKVILNRVKSPDYPKTICGVVYQGSQRRNSCQFSFACDGLPDDIRQPAAWAQSKRVAQKALAGDKKVAAMLGGALNYHADYVKPKWARSMRKAIKIGRHIFYTGG